MFGQPGVLAGPAADLADSAGGDGLIGHGAREEEVARPGGLPVAAEDLQEPRGEHDVAVFLPLALADADDHAWLSMSVTRRRVTSEIRNPAA